MQWKQTGKLPYKNGRIISGSDEEQVYENGLNLPEYKDGKSVLSAQTLYEKLRRLGFDHNSSVGIMGNMMAESGFDVNARHPKGLYHGLAQNSTDIRNAIIKQYGNYGVDSQLRYISDWADKAKWITRNGYTTTNAGRFLKRGYKTPEEAARKFVELYERAVVRDKNGNIIKGQYQKWPERKDAANDLDKKVKQIELLSDPNPIPYPERTGDNYNYTLAAKRGYSRDESGRLPSRDEADGTYLKKPGHPTMLKSMLADMSMGYIPSIDKSGDMFSRTWAGNEAFEEMMNQEPMLPDVRNVSTGPRMIPVVPIQTINDLLWSNQNKPMWAPMIK